MASSAVVVKAGYWIFGRDLNRQVAEIPSELFTHLYAGFANVEDDGHLIIPEPYSEPFRTFTQTVRLRNPGVKTFLSIGGEGADLSPVVASSDKRKNLITDSKDLAKKFHFDGLDLCWLYPASKADEEHLDSLLKEWRLATTLLLTAAVFHHPGIPDKDGKITFNYPIQAIKDNLDWINVLAIDFYTPSNSPQETGPVHAWDTRKIDQQDKCGSVGIQKWIDGGVATNKLVLGLPFYGYDQWILQSPNSFSGFFAPTYTDNKIPKAMAYREIQEELRGGTDKTVFDSQYYAVYSLKQHHNGGLRFTKWIGYDDGLCIFGKVRKAIELKLGGYFAWCVGADDVYWTLSRSAFESTFHPGANSYGGQ